MVHQPSNYLVRDILTMLAINAIFLSSTYYYVKYVTLSLQSMRGIDLVVGGGLNIANYGSGCL